jgi:quinol monooxygenase YgiN
MINLEILVQISTENRHEFMQAFDMFSRKQAEDKAWSGACLDRSIYECCGTAGCFLWLEKWTDARALEAHIQTDHFKAILGAIEVLGELEAIYKGELLELNDWKI